MRRRSWLLTARGGWTILGLGLLCLGYFSLSFQRDQWPGFVGDEATYWIQAESLAYDFDLRFDRHDFDRFQRLHGMAPEGLILQKHPKKAHYVFGKPFIYALWSAPWVRLFPHQGIFFANWLALVLASWIAALGLQSRLGDQAPLWISLFVFASVCFAWVFWAHPDLFLMCLSASALGLALKEPQNTRKPDGPLRWIIVGTLAAWVLLSRPFYAPLILPLIFTGKWFSSYRFRWLLVGFLGIVSLGSGIQFGMSGQLTSYFGVRQGFYTYTGFPHVDYSPEETHQAGSEEESADWHSGVPDTNLAVQGWNILFFGFGRNVGLFPYFLPLFVALLSAGWLRKADYFLLPAALLSALAFLYFRPFNFWGGGGSLANRYFLPLYPLFWYLPRPSRSARKFILAFLVAAPFLYPLWLGSARWPLENGVPRYVSPVAQKILPFESTQLHLKPSGRDDVVHQGLWLKALDTHLVAREDSLEFTEARPARLIVGSAHPLTVLEIRSEGQAPRRVDLQSVHHRHHSMWWTSEPFHLYFLTLDPSASEGGRWVLRPIADP